MPRALRYEDYVNIGKAHYLALKESLTPASERAPCKWICLKCNAKVTRSYRNIKENGGHRCQNPKALTIRDYVLLAESLEIAWAGTELPANTKILTEWVGKNNEIVEASYAHLKYHLTDVMRVKLGLKGAVDE